MSKTLNRAVDRDAKQRMAATGESLTTARKAVRIIRELMDDNNWSFADATAFYDDPRNELLCATCGWTKGMICPECVPGCGCVTNCSGYRHDGWRQAWDDELDACMDCGGDKTSPYGCSCGR